MLALVYVQIACFAIDMSRKGTESMGRTDRVRQLMSYRQLHSVVGYRHWLKKIMLKKKKCR